MIVCFVAYFCTCNGKGSIKCCFEVDYIIIYHYISFLSVRQNVSCLDPFFREINQTRNQKFIFYVYCGGSLICLVPQKTKFIIIKLQFIKSGFAKFIGSQIS